MPFPSNPLETALAAMRDGTAVSERRLLQALADNTLWLPVPGDEGDLPILNDWRGPHVVVFTSAEQFARGAGDIAHRELTGRELAESIPGELGFALNLGAERGLPVNAAGVAVIRGGGKVKRPPRLEVPAEEPVELLDALSGRFAGLPVVLEARRAVIRADDSEPRLLIGVRLDPAAGGPGTVLSATIGMPFEVMFMDDDDPMTAWLLAETEPFYRR